MLVFTCASTWIKRFGDHNGFQSSAGVTPEVNLKYPFHPGEKKQGVHPGFETQGRHHQKAKTGGFSNP